jgi:hypothetical protein
MENDFEFQQAALRTNQAGSRPLCLPEQRKPVLWVDSLFVKGLLRLQSTLRHFLGLLGPSLQVGAECLPAGQQQVY